MLKVLVPTAGERSALEGMHTLQARQLVRRPGHQAAPGPRRQAFSRARKAQCALSSQNGQLRGQIGRLSAQVDKAPPAPGSRSDRVKANGEQPLPPCSTGGNDVRTQTETAPSAWHRPGRVVVAQRQKAERWSAHLKTSEAGGGSGVAQAQQPQGGILPGPNRMPR